MLDSLNVWKYVRSVNLQVYIRTVCMYVCMYDVCMYVRVYVKSERQHGHGGGSVGDSTRTARRRCQNLQRGLIYIHTYIHTIIHVYTYIHTYIHTIFTSIGIVAK